MSAKSLTCRPGPLGGSRDHRWRVIGFNPGFAGGRDHVHVQCRRCGGTLVAEIVATT